VDRSVKTVLSDWHSRLASFTNCEHCCTPYDHAGRHATHRYNCSSLSAMLSHSLIAISIPTIAGPLDLTTSVDRQPFSMLRKASRPVQVLVKAIRIDAPSVLAKRVQKVVKTPGTPDPTFRSQELILFPKLRIYFADFPYLHYSTRLEATHLGDLLRIRVRLDERINLSL